MTTPVRLTLILFFVAVAGVLIGCEVVTDSKDIPYTPHLVVYGLLSTEDTGVTVEVRRTLPLSKAYIETDAWITDARVAVTVDGKSYDLAYIDSGHYVANGLRVETGKTYHLDVDWNGLHTSGETTIPAPSPIDTGFYNISLDEWGYPSATVWLMTHVSSPVALLGAYEYQRTLTAYDSLRMAQDPFYRPDTSWHSDGVYYSNIALATAAPIDSVSFRFYGDIYNGENYRAVLYTYDRSFYEFARTYNRHDDDSPFGSSGINPHWNMTGDGIGIFVGAAVTTKPVQLQ